MHEFLTAAQLGIPEEYRNALILTLAALEGGEIKHHEFSEKTNLNIWETDNASIPEKGYSGLFNMANWAMPTTCGTVCCIGGTAELLGDVEFYKTKMPDALDDLFYPPSSDNIEKDYYHITVEQAAVATRNYLEKGYAEWPEILELAE